jgi:hypothetical protein
MNEVDKIAAAILAAAYSFKHSGAVNHVHFVRAYQNMLEEIQRPDSGEIKASDIATSASEPLKANDDLPIKASDLAALLEDVIRNPRSESH